MWFKNLRLYQVTENLNTDQEQLEQALAAFKFTPCTSQEAIKMGFTLSLIHI